MKDKSLFWVAILLSVVFHLIFAAGAEAAYQLAHWLKPAVPRLFFEFNSPEVSNTKNVAASVARKKSSQAKSRTQNGTAPKKAKPVSSIRSDVLKFEEYQDRMNERIQKFEKNLLMKQISSVDMVVFHHESIPADFQKQNLPQYLKGMRSQISKYWLQNLNSFGCDSCQATVQFRIVPDGTVSHIEVVQSSGTEIFQSICAESVKKAGPFGVLPFKTASQTSEQYVSVALTYYYEGRKLNG